MNINILKAEVQEYLETHLGDDISKTALSKSPFQDVTAREIAEQLDGKQRSAKKLPLWSTTRGIIFPRKLSLEQSSSELTAQYKTSLIRGDKLIDLTGGFGVDTWYFSKVAKEVIHCERDEELSAIARHNLHTLGASNIRFVNADSIAFLQESSETFDTIFVDPARRIQSKKVFMLRDTEPDVAANLPFLLSRASRIIIKTSPLLDIQSGLQELNSVSSIHVLSIKNDCKELLWVIDEGFTGEPEIICAALSNGGQQPFNFKISEEKKLELNSYQAPLTYLYEPDVTLLKAGAFKSIAERFQIAKLHPNTHLYTSDKLLPNFPGKTFKVNKVVDYKYFSKENSINKANVISRNFPLSPNGLKKKHKLTDGGEHFLFFTKASPDALVVISGSSQQTP